MDKKMHVSGSSKLIFINTHPLHSIDGYIKATKNNKDIQLIINLIIYRTLTTNIRESLVKSDSKLLHGWGMRVNSNIEHDIFKHSFSNLRSIVIAVDSNIQDVECIRALIDTIKHNNEKIAIYLEVTSLDIIEKLVTIEFHGLVITGCDASLVFSNSSSFILFQKFKKLLNNKRILVKGGLGIYSVTGFILAGADGVVFESELYGFKELDLSECCYRLVGDQNAINKAYSNPSFSDLEELSSATKASIISEENEAECIGRESLLSKYLEDEGSISQLVNSIYTNLANTVYTLTKQYPITKNCNLSITLGTELPIVQGPMAWISDKQDFAQFISSHGALPVFATGTMKPDEIKQLLDEVNGSFEYGVGLIGFENHKLMKSQVETLKEYDPSTVILAGGSTNQAEFCRNHFKNVFVHVPSHKLIDSFIKSGHNQFIFEGSESGGHISGLTSQILWETSVHELLRNKIQLSGLSILAAGGLSGEISSIFVSSLYAVLINKGVNIGLQLGTAYLATKEAVASRAISEVYNKQVAHNNSTLVLGSPVGHRVRVTNTKMSRLMRDNEITYLNGNITIEDLKKSIESKVSRSRELLKKSDVNQLTKCLFMSGDISGHFKSDFSIKTLHEELSDKALSLFKNNSKNKISYLFLLCGSSQQEISSKLNLLMENINRYALDDINDYCISQYSSNKSYKLGFIFSSKIELFILMQYSLDNVVISNNYIYENGIAYNAGQTQRDTKIALIFPGQGAQYVSMLTDLKNYFKCIEDTHNNKRALIKKLKGIDPWDEYSTNGRLSHEWHAQLIIWSLESTLLDSVITMNAEFDYVLGHSLGEIAAFEALGLVEPSIIAEMVYERGHLMKDKFGSGGLTIVFVDKKTAKNILDTVGGSLQIANFNSDKQIAIAGTLKDLKRLESILKRAKVAFYRLSVNFPFHSDLFHDVTTAYYKYLTTIIKPGDIEKFDSKVLKRIISNLTASDYHASYAALQMIKQNASGVEVLSELISRMLSEQISHQVKFEQSIKTLYKSGVRVFIELGPGNTLSGLVRNSLTERDIIIQSALEKNSEVVSYYKSLMLFGVFSNINFTSELAKQGLKPNDLGVRRIKRILEKSNLTERNKKSHKPSDIHDNDIAIVSIALKGPGANDIDEYWQNILEKICSIDEIPDKKWRTSDFYDPDIEATDKTYGNVAGITEFDISNSINYGFQPKAAGEIDRMQIVALQLAEELVTNLGYNPKTFPHRDTSVVIGYAYPEKTTGQYAGRLYYEHLKKKFEESYHSGLIDHSKLEIILNLLKDEEDLLPNYSSTAAVACLSNMISARIARYLDIDQPNYVIDSACATSLSAFDVACMQLRSSKCSYAISGGLDDFSAGRQVGFARTFALSIKGSCTPFDEKADGLIQGDGAGLVMLATVKTAKTNNNKILGIIKGIGGSSDGKTSRNLVTPSYKRQSLSIKRALEEASWDAGDVDYIEAHGTGTALGDHAEMQSLKEHFSGLSKKSIPVGSVKANIGHTMIAAGTFSLAKVLQAVNNGLIPPQIGIDKVNPRLNIDDSPLYFPTNTEIWLRRD
jgi:acyl transferase domain-containing protein/NAD(P)H-dependent flavin oxidoreductase YrpB (nitropropane dioxygenase family)